MTGSLKTAREKSLTIGCPSGTSSKKNKIVTGYARQSHPDPRGWLFFSDGPYFYVSATFEPDRHSRFCNPRSRQSVTAALAVFPAMGGTAALAGTES